MSENHSATPTKGTESPFEQREDRPKPRSKSQRMVDGLFARAEQMSAAEQAREKEKVAKLQHGVRKATKLNIAPKGVTKRKPQKPLQRRLTEEELRQKQAAALDDVRNQLQAKITSGIATVDQQDPLSRAKDIFSIIAEATRRSDQLFAGDTEALQKVYYRALAITAQAIVELNTMQSDDAETIEEKHNALWLKFQALVEEKLP